MLLWYPRPPRPPTHPPSSTAPSYVCLDLPIACPAAPGVSAIPAFIPPYGYIGREREFTPSNPPIHLILVHPILSPLLTPPRSPSACVSLSSSLVVSRDSLPHLPLCCHPIPVLPSPQSLVPCRVFPSINQPPILRCLTHPHSFLRPLPFLYHPRFCPSLLLLSFALFCRPHPSPTTSRQVVLDILSPPSRILYGDVDSWVLNLRPFVSWKGSFS
ncbi:hypothetical protein LY78DRAFT_316037 [Colletotrichum sublineola]|nr:hypothetical protein LY78DRAFT_316037 [Colletotrichum sublineola]